jgi:hypothetical protein
MPALDLFVDAIEVKNLPSDGILVLNPPLPTINRVLLRRLSCILRVPGVRGVRQAILDTASPLSVFPYHVWHGIFNWQEGHDFDELSIAGVGKTLQGQILGHRYSCRLVHLRVAIELSGKNLKGDRLKLDSLICQLADPGNMPYILLGLWGGPFVGSRLVVDRMTGSDDLEARLEY